MFSGLDLYTRRYIQIVFMCMLGQTIYLYTNIPHNSWIVISVCTVYSGFNAGTVIKRAYHRLIGTIAGVSLVVIIWHFIHLDYRLLIIFTTLVISVMVFCITLPYNRFIIISTVFSDITMEWSNSSSFSVYYYVMDRLICIAIVFSLCIIAEYFWFGRANLSYLNYKQTQKNLLKDLNKLYELSQSTCKNGMIFKLINGGLAEVEKLKSIAADVKFEGRSFAKQEKLDQGISRVVTLQRNIVSLNYLITSNGEAATIQQLKTNIEIELRELTSSVNKPAETYKVG